MKIQFKAALFFGLLHGTCFAQVGIGTNSPVDKLTVYNGNVSIQNANTVGAGSLPSTNGSLKFYGSNSSTSYWAGIESYRNGYADDVDLRFFTQLGASPSERMRITSDGNLGIGTTSPGTLSGAKFEVVQGTTAKAVARLVAPSSKTSTTQEYPFYITTSEAWSSNPFGFEFGLKGNSTSSSRVAYIQAMTVNSTNDGVLSLQPNGGNVGIGTTSPNNTASNRTVLDINGTTQSLLNFSTGGASKGYIYNDGTNIQIYSSGALSHSTGSGERMRITSDGNIGINTNSPTSLLEIVGINGSNATSSLVVKNSAGQPLLYVRNDGNVGIGTNGPAYKLEVNGDINAIGSVRSSGSIISSDMRLKNITESILSEDNINIIKYEWKDGRDDRVHIGYGAQEVERILPDAVYTDAEGLKAVNYDEVHTYKIMQLEQMVKELQQQNAELKKLISRKRRIRQ